MSQIIKYVYTEICGTYKKILSNVHFYRTDYMDLKLTIILTDFHPNLSMSKVR